MYKDNEVLCQFFYQPIQIVKLEELLCDKRGRLAYPLIIVVYEGHAIYTLQGRQLQLSSNSIMFVDDVDDFQLLKANECTGVVIIYRAYGPNIINLLQDTTLMEHCSYRLMNLVKEIEREAKITVESNLFRLQKLFSEMLEELYNHLCIHKQQEGLWIDRVLDYMNLNFNEDLTREQMAEKAQVSPEHFSRTFHRYTGYTYSEYLTLLRIRESQKNYY